MHDNQDSVFTGEKPILARTVVIALLFNAAWELAQCPIFYDMAGVGWVKGALGMVAAIFGDALTVLALVSLTRLLVGRRFLPAPEAKGWVVLLGLSVVAGGVLEWIARSQHRWEYNSLMPVMHIAGISVGWLPVAQITLLPALSLRFAQQADR